MTTYGPAGSPELIEGPPDDALASFPLKAAVPIGVISPHMDDAALSCGALLGDRPGSEVVTVFSSGPTRVSPLPWWDQVSGCFRAGDNVMALRAAEDDSAMKVVGAHARRLGFWDEQYRAGRPLRIARLRPRAVKAQRARLDDPQLEVDVARVLREVVESSPIMTWFIPLGLWHPDHKKTARACLRVASNMPAKSWFVYEELPYRLEVPEDAAAMRRQVHEARLSLEPVPGGGEVGSPATATKWTMIECYRSQLPCLGPRAQLAACAPEVYYRLARLGDQAPATSDDQTVKSNSPATR